MVCCLIREVKLEIDTQLLNHVFNHTLFFHRSASCVNLPALHVISTSYYDVSDTHAFFSLVEKSITLPIIKLHQCINIALSLFNKNIYQTTIMMIINID